MTESHPTSADGSAASTAPNEGGAHGPGLLGVVGTLWTAERTARALNVAIGDLSDARRSGSVLGVVSADGDVFYPVEQFEQLDSQVRVKPTVLQFLGPLCELDGWTVAVLLKTPAAELDGLTPMSWAREGRDLATVANYAELLAIEYSR